MPSKSLLAYMTVATHLKIKKAGEIQLSLKNVLNAVDLAKVYCGKGVKYIEAFAMGLYKGYEHAAGHSLDS